MTRWLLPRLHGGALHKLETLGPQDLCWDDSGWLDLLAKQLHADPAFVAEELAEELETATLRVYHGCNTADAGSYFREGLRVHDRQALTRSLEARVAAEPSLASARCDLERLIAEVDNGIDEGRLYVVLDDTFMVRHSAHYLIYGSEWASAVLGRAGLRNLLVQGAPTMILIDLPLRRVEFQFRTALASRLLQEWTRLRVNRANWSAPIDFTFSLHVDIPPACVIGHYHPPDPLPDPFAGYEPRTGLQTHCAYCAGQHRRPQ